VQPLNRHAWHKEIDSHNEHLTTGYTGTYSPLSAEVGLAYECCHKPITTSGSVRELHPHFAK